MTLALLLLGCGQATHLQYDYGRAFGESFATQATLDRASAANDGYAIGGAEALATRENARDAATDTEGGTPTVTASAEAGQ
jgi:hypothetical protein